LCTCNSPLNVIFLHLNFSFRASSSYIDNRTKIKNGGRTMGQVKTVGVRELKNQLSAHLREVKAGHRLLVTERSIVIAELRPPVADDMVLHATSVMDDWVNTGVATPPRSPREPLPESPVRLPDGTSRRLLAELRDE
jgi:antitoxin (DNA-binding transcriptional repressor) of toxin-antitoxin stability system